MNNKLLKTGFIITVLLIVGCIYSCKRTQSIDELIVTTESESESGMESVEETQTNETTDTQSMSIVHVCGCVKTPDVYELDSDARVRDAIVAAGGYTDDAVTDYLNLAQVVSDGMKIYVPSIEEYESGMIPNQNLSMEDSDGKTVNINTATKDELMTLSGIGESRAQDIIAYRQEHGRFTSKEDIMLVPGIKNASYEKFKDDITV